MLFCLVFIVIYSTATSQVAINTSGAAPNNSAMLDVSSNTSGILIPRMIESDRINIASPVEGLTGLPDRQ